MYDKQEKAVFGAAVLNGDYVKKQNVDMTSHPVNGKIAVFYLFFIKEHLHSFFPTAVSYNRFVELESRVAIPM